MQKAEYANCKECPLIERAFVPSDTIKPDAQYTLVGESPGAMEGQQGISFVGPSGKLLWATLKQLGVSRDHCNVTNAVLCQPSSNPTVKKKQMPKAVECCFPRLNRELIDYGGDSPILLMGRIARDAVVGTPADKESRTTLHGRWMNFRLGRPVMSTTHPAAVLRAPDNARNMFDDITKFVKQAHEPLVLPKPPTYTIITDLDQLDAIQGSVLAFDLETAQIELGHRILLLVLSSDECDNHSYIVPGNHPTGPSDLLYSTKTDPRWKAFWSRWKVLVGHNGKFDVKFLRHHFQWDFVKCTSDTMLAHSVIDERPGNHDLKGLSARFLNVRDYEIGLHTHLKSRNDLYSKIPWDILCQYAAWDAVCTLRLSYVFSAVLRKEDTYRDPFMSIHMPLQEILTEMELRGWQVDEEHLETQGADMDRQLLEIENEFYELTEQRVTNIRSPMQLAKFYYDYLRLPLIRARRAKPRTTGKEFIEVHGDRHPSIALLKVYRRIHKMRRSYVENLLNIMDDNGVVHCDMKIHGTESGRVSVTKPPLQTIPRPGNPKDPISRWGKVIKDAFVARPGMSILNVDYSQAEMRVAAALSGDPWLIGVYENDRDLHTEVAVAMYGPDWTKEDRIKTKMFNFSYLYGGNEWSFAADAGLPISVAKKFVADYDNLMPKLSEWKAGQVAHMHKHGYVEYRTGRRRRIPLITSKNKDEARKASFNAPVQGTASDLTSLAAIESYPKLPTFRAHILLLVHDSIIVEVPKELVKACATYLAFTMERVAKEWFPEVKWVADAEAGPRWGSMKEVSFE
jgi:DNA polymerase-1